MVDLQRFRAQTAGDRLRGMYHALSADPNSLANLDQDLPNSMQQQIPIFTLDKDWLWCQTWCSDESLKTAKTSEWRPSGERSEARGASREVQNAKR